MAAALGAAWGAVVMVAAWLRRPPPRRVRALARVDRRPGRPGRADGLAVALASVAGRFLRRPVRPEVAARVGIAVLLAALSLPVAPPLGLASAVGVGAVPVLRARRAKRRHEAAVRRSLPEVVDLFVVAVGAGLTVRLAVEAVARRASGPVADELRVAVADLAAGRRLADALSDVPTRAEATRPLVAALVAAERYGGPLLDRLARLADEARADGRRRAEEAARRVPVTLLFPLVFCTLPAFALLTVAPLLAGGLRSLRP